MEKTKAINPGKGDKKSVNDNAKIAGGAAVGVIAGAAVAYGADSLMGDDTEDVQDVEELYASDDVEVVEATAPQAEEEPQVEPQTPEEATPPAPQPQQPETPAVNPEEVADGIIAETKIDPNDNDAEDIINFTDIGKVYDVEGNEYTAVRVQDINGNSMVMVDVDNDGVLDIVTDENLNPVLDENGNMMACGNMTVGDAVLDQHHEPGYIAQVEHDHPEDFIDPSAEGDMIS